MLHESVEKVFRDFEEKFKEEKRQYIEERRQERRQYLESRRAQRKEFNRRMEMEIADMRRSRRWMIGILITTMFTFAGYITAVIHYMFSTLR